MDVCFQSFTFSSEGSSEQYNPKAMYSSKKSEASAPGTACLNSIAYSTSMLNITDSAVVECDVSCSVLGMCLSIHVPSRAVPREWYLTFMRII